MRYQLAIVKFDDRPRYLRAVRDCRACAGNGTNLGTGEACRGCTGTGTVAMVREMDPLRELARYRRDCRQHSPFYRSFRRIAMKRVRLPGGAR
jgi:hypothetical protein